MAKAQMWSPQEDQILLDHFAKGPNFASISMKINDYNKTDITQEAGPKGPKTAEDCQRRIKLLQKTKKLGRFTKEEDDKIIKGYKKLGANWAFIARKYIPGRNGKQICERFRNVLKKQLNNPTEQTEFTKQEDALLVQKINK
mmetsp:Transcript_13564/g.12043  ORF Transcript_13564/g.12043 Transcript_13564/m.12043 type:complete len:142 (-) Transcript_13564:208-633(-)